MESIKLLSIKVLNESIKLLFTVIETANLQISKVKWILKDS